MLKYTVRLLLWENDPDRNGLLPIYICVTINRKRAYIATGIVIAKNAWEPANERIAKGHRLNAEYNADLSTRKQKIVQMIAEAQVKGEMITAAQVKQRISGKSDPHNIFQFIDAYITECRGKKEDSTLENYRKHALRLELFHGCRSLSFEDITPEFLAAYEKHLRVGTKTVKAVDGNYVHALWRTLKTFFNAAKDRKVITCYPFDQYENPIYDDPEKEHLSMAELKNWEKYADTVTDPTKKQTAIWFLLGCYAGLRISDWFRFDIKKRVIDARVKIRAKKNGEWVSMPVSKPLARNLVRMQSVPLTITEPEINRSLKDIALELHIDKYLTTHCGRHSFAVTICAERGISVETCANLMGITVDTCYKAYYRVTNKKIDAEALKAWKGL